MQQYNITIFHGSNIRLDRYLRRLYPYLTQGIIEKALRAKQIAVNDMKATSSLRLKNTDKISMISSLIQNNHVNETCWAPGVILLAKKIIGEYLLYDHEQFIAINKPAGLSAQGGSKITISVDQALKYLNYTDKYNFKLVHRIDKNTSGVMLIAKDYEPATILTGAFKDQVIKKTYLAIVKGQPNPSMGRISNFIAKNTSDNYQKVEINSTEGKLAITDYKLLKKLPNNLSLIEFQPLTGRMHQIRVHARELGCPILGDNKYGSVDKSAHMYLHAYRIFLPDSIFERNIEITAELPKYFQLSKHTYIT